MLTKSEKEYLRKLVEKDLQKFQEEEKGIVDISPGFLEGEKKYEEFLRDILEKLE
jgi:hypothetical protein